MKFYIYTLGCKVNIYESEMMKEKLLKNGFTYDEKKPDFFIINTCSVTNMADQKSKKMFRHFKKKFPNTYFVVCGCSSFHKQEEYKNLGIDILIGNTKKSEIVKLIKTFLKEKESYTYFSNTRNLDFEDMKVDKFTTHTRAFVKIEDGCDNFCSYCIIPYVRGSIRSKEFNVALKEIETLVNNGHKEIVLTGIHTGRYGYNTDYDLTDLVHEMSKLEKLGRIRISSIEITELTDKFLNELKINDKICDHLHIPLQAGSNEILKKMNRKYTLEEYEYILNRIRNIRPDISITTDIIVGHPYETEELFLKTIETVKKFSFSKIHVFPYSKRDGTLAASMPKQVEEKEKHERSKRLITISKELESNYAKKFIGKNLDVLIERDSTGYSSNYLKVKLNKKIENNSFITTKIIKEANSVLYADEYSIK